MLVMKGHSEPVTSLAIMDDKILSGCEDGSIRSYKIPDIGSKKGSLEEEIQRLKVMGIDQQFNMENTTTSPKIASPIASADEKKGMKERKGSITKIFAKGERRSKGQSSSAIDLPHSPSLGGEGTRPRSSSDFIQDEFVGWYVGPMPREKAEAALMQCAYNSFLVRNSSIPGCYALTKYVPLTKAFQHLLIVHENTKYYIKDSFDTAVYK
jgi:hypothetical protein